MTNGIAARIADTFCTCCIHVRIEAVVELDKSPQPINEETLLKYFSLSLGSFGANEKAVPEWEMIPATS